MRVFSLIRKQRLMPFQRRYSHHSLPTNLRSAISIAQRFAGSTFRSRDTSGIRAAPLLLPWWGNPVHAKGKTTPPSKTPSTRMFSGV